MNSLPAVFHNIFGNLVSEIGTSSGDYNSPLQNIVKNLGRVGIFPLIVVRLIETIGSIFKYLKKNQFFRQFLLPGLVLGLTGGAILFLIFFLQQEEPYGYLGYENRPNYDYPQYQSNNYRSRYDDESVVNFNDINPSFRYNIAPNTHFDRNIDGNYPFKYSRGYLSDNMYFRRP
ncbi:hypothetical protein ABEB36_008860 [Hypothenemus hampei]|uniref:Uncharacterized protein n=1 Tax=Hypothenemus hampei TaxID=57062 RepID=A0ABD1ER83_HYPHA